MNATKKKVAPLTDQSEFGKDTGLKWYSTNLTEISNSGFRLEASVYGSEKYDAISLIKSCKWPLKTITGDLGFADSVFYPKRFKRSYIVDHLDSSRGFLGSSEMLDILPKPIKFINDSDSHKYDLNVKNGWVLLSRSGTVGNVTFVSKTLEKFCISEHAIRLVSKFPGYLYAYLKSKIGKSLIESAIYGAVVDQIEPEHLNSIFIPNPDKDIKQRINDIIIKSFNLRDQSNELIVSAEELLLEALKCKNNPSLRKDSGNETHLFSQKLSLLNNRFEASYHKPIYDDITNILEKNSRKLLKVGDSKISKKIILPGRFKRSYVDSEHGVPFIGGKQLFQLDPTNVKYLSKTLHSERISQQLTLDENMILVTCSGTIGKVTIVPEHWSGWTANQHILRVIPTSVDIAGYIFAFLSTEIGSVLIKRHTYGSVVDEITDLHLSEVPIPILEDTEIQNTINGLVLKANILRTKAYYLEKEAINICNEDVIFK